MQAIPRRYVKLAPLAGLQFRSESHTHTHLLELEYILFPRNAKCVKERKQHSSHSVLFWWFSSLPFWLSAFMFCSGSLSLCLKPSFITPFCATVYSKHKQIQLLHFIQPVISLVDCIKSCTEKCDTNSLNVTFCGILVLFSRRWELLLCFWYFEFTFRSSMKLWSLLYLQTMWKVKLRMWEVCVSDRRWDVE